MDYGPGDEEQGGRWQGSDEPPAARLRQTELTASGPVTAGRSAVTRGRARRDPVKVAGLTTGYTLVLGVTASTHPLALAGALLVLQLALVAGWARAAGYGGPDAVIAGACVSAAALAGFLPGVLPEILERSRLVAAAFALCVPAAFVAGVVRLVRRNGDREDRPAGVTAMVTTVAGAVLAALPAAWLPLAGEGRTEVAVALVVVAAAALLEPLAHRFGLSRSIVAVVTGFAALGIGAGIGLLAPSFGVAQGATLGFSAGLLAAAGVASAEYVRARGSAHVPLAAALPLASVAPAAYLVGRMFAG